MHYLIVLGLSSLTAACLGPLGLAWTVLAAIVVGSLTHFALRRQEDGRWRDEARRDGPLDTVVDAVEAVADLAD
jgi:hypothetical protein